MWNGLHRRSKLLSLLSLVDVSGHDSQPYKRVLLMQASYSLSLIEFGISLDVQMFWKFFQTPVALPIRLRTSGYVLLQMVIVLPK